LLISGDSNRLAGRDAIVIGLAIRKESTMSHHLDSPLARQDIRLDITDHETDTVFVINVCHSIFGPIRVPGYHPEGMMRQTGFDGFIPARTD
jgi:hypothetical protein